MIISLPMTSNTEQIFSSLLFKWKAQRDTEENEFKQTTLKQLRKTWWNRTFNKKTSDNDLLKDSSLTWNLNYHSIFWKWEGRIDDLTSLLAAHKLAVLTKTSATYDVQDHLIKHLNKELTNEKMT